MRYLLLTGVVLGIVIANLAAAQTPAAWPTQDGTFTIPRFLFGTGESMPELHLHYLTLGKPHTDTSGHTDKTNRNLRGSRQRDPCQRIDGYPGA